MLHEPEWEHTVLVSTSSVTESASEVDVAVGVTSCAASVVSVSSTLSVIVEVGSVVEVAICIGGHMVFG
jgi:hypothetical protein